MSSLDALIQQVIDYYHLTPSEITQYQHPEREAFNDPQALTEGLSFVTLFHQDCKQAIQSHRTVAICPDYDVDGIMSGMILYSVLSDLYPQLDLYLYHPRTETGFGLSPTSIQDILKAKPRTQTVITSDNGSSSFSGVQYANTHGLRVFITDHHLSETTLPEPVALVNPKRQDQEETYCFDALSGTGVAYKVMQLLITSYHPNVSASYILRYTPFVGLSVLSDVMAMRGENRRFVACTVYFMTYLEQFLHLANSRTVSGRFFQGFFALLTVLSEEGKLQYGLDETTLGFYIAPLLNTPRRLFGASEEGFKLFQSSSPTTAYDQARHLFDWNEQRKREVNKVYEGVLQAVDSSPHFDPHFLCPVVNTRHGFSGLISGRLTDNFQLPTIVFGVPVDSEAVFVDPSTLPENFVLSASCRSTDWFHLHREMKAIQTSHPEWFKTFGGHAKAAGCSIYNRYYEDFVQTFFERVQDVIRQTPVADREEEGLTLTVFNQEVLKPFYQFIQSLKPFGEDFPPPVFSFVLSDYTVKYMGKDSVHVKLVDNVSGFSVVWFFGAATMRTLEGQTLKVVGSLLENTFNGKTTIQCKAESVRV